MSNKLNVEVEEEEPKKDVELEGEGIPRSFSRSSDYLRGYKAGWMVAKKNLLKKMSQSGQQIEEKSTEKKPIGKQKSKKEDEETIFWVAILGAVVLGGILFVFFNESNRKRNTPS